MFTLALAYILNSPATASAAYTVTETATVFQMQRAERAARTADLGRWLDSMDGVRMRALAVYSPFADDEEGDESFPFAR